MDLEQVSYLFVDVGNVLFHDFAVDVQFSYNVYHRLKGRVSIEYLLHYRMQELKQENTYWIYKLCRAIEPELANRILQESWEEVIQNWLEINIPIRGAIEALNKLSHKVKIAIVANQPKETRLLLQKYGITDFVSEIILDEELGISKPDLQFFTTSLQMVNIEANHVIMIGDRLENDIIPAQKCGLGAIWVLYQPEFTAIKSVPIEWQEKYYESYRIVAPYNVSIRNTDMKLYTKVCQINSLSELVQFVRL